MKKLTLLLLTLLCLLPTAAQKKPGTSPSGSLPVLYINMENGSDDILNYDLGDKDYRNGTYWLDLNGCQWLSDEGAKSIASESEPLPLQIKARGNYTRCAFAKKPFKLKLGDKQKLLGLTKSKHFALLAHADDSFGYLRNFIGFNLGKRIGLPWTPAQQPVELVINGDYRGLYFLTESIRIDEDRVNINELEAPETTPNLASGGFIVEFDNYTGAKGEQIKMDAANPANHKDDIPFYLNFDTPEYNELSDSQKGLIGMDFARMNELINSRSDELWSYLDLDDAVRYYIVMEMISHYEAYHGSTYLFRDRGADRKWHFSPLWDLGHAFDGQTDSYFYDCDPYGNTWIPSIRLNDKFNNRVNETWKWFMVNCYDGLITEIDSYISHIRAAVGTDYARWEGIRSSGNGYEPEYISDNRNLDNRRNAAVNHLTAKINWLRGQWGDYSGNHPEPTRDLTPAHHANGWDTPLKLSEEDNNLDPGTEGDVYIYIHNDANWGSLNVTFIRSYDPDDFYTNGWNGTNCTDYDPNLRYGDLQGFYKIKVPAGDWASHEVFIHDSGNIYRRYPHDNLYGAAINNRSHIFVTSSGLWLEVCDSTDPDSRPSQTPVIKLNDKKTKATITSEIGDLHLLVTEYDGNWQWVQDVLCSPEYPDPLRTVPFGTTDWTNPVATTDVGYEVTLPKDDHMIYIRAKSVKGDTHYPETTVLFNAAGDDLPTGVGGITETTAPASPEYYDLTGRRVQNPTRGIYIRRTGSRAEKILL